MIQYILRVFLAALLLVPALSVAGQVQVRALVDSTSMLIGDQVHLKLEAKAARGISLADPYWPPNNDTLEFLSLGKWDTLSTGTLIYKAVFTMWDTGYQVLPPIGIPYSGNGLSDTAWTTALIMEVRLPTDSLKLNDIKDIVREPAVFADYLPYLYALGAIVLIGLIIWFWRHPVKVKKEVPPPPPPLPHEVALEQLAALAQKKLWQQGMVKEYHSELTHIVREYLEGRFDINALEETTEEILDQLRKRNLPSALRQRLEEILQTADMVKFAKAQPTAQFHEQAFESVKAFVEQTKPVRGVTRDT
jgi:hypothetical protein